MIDSKFWETLLINHQYFIDYVKNSEEENENGEDDRGKTKWGIRF